jgi:NADH-quinone oxidoreductase subunit G
LLPRALAEIVVAAANAAGKAVPDALAGVKPSATAEAIAASLQSGERKGIFLGNFAQQHPQASQLHALAQLLAELTGARMGFLTEAANSVGGHVAEALPRQGGLDGRAMLATPRKAYILLHVEPELDTTDPALTRTALSAAEFVVALSSFQSATQAHADVQLPVAPFTETAGTFVNCEGVAQSFAGAAPPLGDTRPAWKVLRVLGSMLAVPGFEFENIDDVRAELAARGDIAARLANTTRVAIVTPAPASATGGLERIADVPIYATDPLVRRAPSLQKTGDARPPVARVNPATLAELHRAEGDTVRVSQGSGAATLQLQADAGVPLGCVRIAAAHPATSALGPMFGSVTVEAL